MSNLPHFQFTTQEDWYWEIPFANADDKNRPLPLVNGDGSPRQFVVPITPFKSGVRGSDVVAELRMNELGDGIWFGDDNTTLIFRLSRSATEDFPLGEFSAHILEVVGSERHLFLPVTINFQEPSAVRTFLRRVIGVTWSKSRQPIITPVAIAGRQGAPGATILYGSQPPGPGVGKNGDFYIEDRTGQNPPAGRIMYGPKAGGIWPGTSWIIQVAGVGDVPGLIGQLDKRVRVDAGQDFSDQEKALARSNLGLSEVSTLSRAQVIELVRDALTGKEF